MTKNVTYVTPLTGGYEAINGQLTKVNPTVNKANRLLSQIIGQDLANPTYGNPLLTKSQITALDIYQDIPICLTPLINTGEVSTVGVIKVTKQVLGRWLVNIQITIPNNNNPLDITWVNKA